MRRTLLALACAASVFALRRTADADTFQSPRDRRAALTLRSGLVHTSDDLVDATWYRPVMLGGSLWLLRSPRRWFDGLQVYGMLGLESADIAYHEDREEDVGLEDLYGIHRADIHADLGATFGFGARLSLYDDGRLSVSAFGDAALPSGSSEVEVSSLLVDVGGLKLDVAKAVRENASVTYSGKTYRLGVTVGWSMGSEKRRWTPYLTAGWLSYSAKLAFDVNDRLAQALQTFGIDASVLEPRTVSEDDAFFAPGLRLDFGRSWSLEAQALLGRYDGTWVSAGLIGGAWRFGR